MDWDKGSTLLHQNLSKDLTHCQWMSKLWYCNAIYLTVFNISIAVKLQRTIDVECKFNWNGNQAAINCNNIENFNYFRLPHSYIERGQHIFRHYCKYLKYFEFTHTFEYEIIYLKCVYCKR